MECLLKAQREGDAYVKDVYEKASNVLEVLLKLYQLPGTERNVYVSVG